MTIPAPTLPMPGSGVQLAVLPSFYRNDSAMLSLIGHLAFSWPLPQPVKNAAFQNEIFM
jgi:hypothetical protein